MTKRYDPELRWDYCYDEPHAVMTHVTNGMWVKYSDYEALKSKLDAFMLEHAPKEMTPDQLRKYSEHQRSV